jgi:hypothetical protein
MNDKATVNISNDYPNVNNLQSINEEHESNNLGLQIV